MREVILICDVKKFVFRTVTPSKIVITSLFFTRKFWNEISTYNVGNKVKYVVQHIELSALYYLRGEKYQLNPIAH